jgi:hypothetical protein
MISKARLLLVVLPSLACALAARAADIQVPAEQPTIQQGIDVAIAGDRVLVAPGTYVEHIDFRGKDIQVIGTAGAAVTTIHGSRRGSVATFSSGETRAAVLAGFTIAHGQADYGGGIHIENASPTIQDNDIRSNHSYNGGGIYIAGNSDPRIHHNRIGANEGGAWAGGINVRSAATIEDNIVEGNTDGGIAVFDAGPVFLGRNVIRDNDGEGILLADGEIYIFDNLIVGNLFAGITDVGLLGSIALVNNTIADNSGSADLHIGWPTGSSTLTIVNNIVRTTLATESVNCWDGAHHAQIRDNLVYASNGGGILGTCEVAHGLIQESPRFVGGSGSHAYWLSPDSPAVDAGDDRAVRRIRHDAAGGPRIVGPAVDLGAYEFRALAPF